jgi:hypothetical protein
MKGSFAGIKLGNKDLFWQFRIRSGLRRVADSYRRASGKAPKEADGKKNFPGILIFLTALTRDLSFVANE